MIRCKFYGGKNDENLFWLKFVFEPKKKKKNLTFFFGNYFLEIIFWKLFFGNYFLEIIFWKLFFGNYFLEIIFWKLFFGNYFLEIIFWKLFFGNYFLKLFLGNYFWEIIFPYIFFLIFCLATTRHTEHCVLLVAFDNSSRRQFVKLKSDSMCLYNIYGSDRYGRNFY